MKPETPEQQASSRDQNGRFATHELISPEGELPPEEADADVPEGGARAEDHAAARTAPALADYEGDLDVTPVGPEDFEPDELRRALRLMMTSRRLDDKMLTLLKQGKGFFHIGASGHEAAQVALGLHLRGGHDWFCFYYRDLALALTLGFTPENTLQAHFAKADDPNGGGRQMPEHFGHRALNIMSTSSSVGAQWMPAVGFGLAVQREQRAGAEGADKVVYVSGGEGSTSQGTFHEALNWAARAQAPCLFHVEDNKYAISVPVWEQTVAGSIWPVLGGYPGLLRAKYDGTDFFTAYAVGKAAVEHVRSGKGPVALLADVVRLLPHSSSDDHAKYRAADDLAADRARDPIAKLAARLVEAGIMTGDEVEAMRAEVQREIDELARAVEQQPDPDPAKAAAYNLYEGPDELEYEKDGPMGDLVVMVDAINHAMDEEMARDERVLVYGEDVGGG
ncbi:MAG TPA: thiamine pyrophosphate-dependent enzyme, partial [Rubricoccaceae bacterium]|nr:thiamine pyrophosphate-dependent enzyme [Rubricoccaceae bacterium]